MSNFIKPEEILRLSAALLLRRKYFYYNLWKQFSHQRANPKEIPTAGVGWVNDRMVFIYNPIFVSLYSPSEFSAIIEHECNHFVFDHCNEFQDNRTKEVFKDEKEAVEEIKKQMKMSMEYRLNNIAMDRSINVYIPNLPKIKLLAALSMDEEVIKKDPKLAAKNLTRLYQWDHNERKVLKEGDPNDAAILQQIIQNKDLSWVVETEGIIESSFKKLLTESKWPGDLTSIPQFESWKYYRELLRECPEIQKQLQGIQDMDIHFEGVGERGESKEVPDRESNRMIIKAYRESNKSNIPGYLAAAIESAIDYYTSKPVPWYRVLRKQINNAKKTIMKQDVNTRNRRHTGKSIIPGYINEPLFSVGVIYDTSGSCYDKETQSQFWNEIEQLRRAKADITVYYTDTEVEHIQKINPNKRLSPKMYEGKGGGGTHLDVGIVQAIKDKCDILIMLTDGWMEFNLTKKDLKGRKVITATTHESAPKHYGPTIKINNDKL